MNLSKLFQIQSELDKRIVKEHGLEGEYLLDKKILALQVELGELAQNWRGFKFWSKDQESRTREYLTNYTEQDSVLGPGAIWRNPLLEEYVDCLHFILSIGLELGIKPGNICVQDDLTGETTTETFNELFTYVSTLHVYLDVNLPAAITKDDLKGAYLDIFECFVGLGESHLKFTWEQIETAYLDKNKINHERQDSGY